MFYLKRPAPVGVIKPTADKHLTWAACHEGKQGLYSISVLRNQYRQNIPVQVLYKISRGKERSAPAIVYIPRRLFAEMPQQSIAASYGVLSEKFLFLLKLQILQELRIG